MDDKVFISNKRRLDFHKGGHLMYTYWQHFVSDTP